jgi:hypothetical protein
VASETFPEIATVLHEAGKKSIFLGNFNALDIEQESGRTVRRR